MTNISAESFRAKEYVFTGDGAARSEVWRSYDVLRAIGRGTFGVVLAARVRETGELVAIKKVRLDVRLQNRELAVMRDIIDSPPPPGVSGSSSKPCACLVLHPNIAHLRAFVADTDRLSGDDFLYFIMDYLPSDLHRVTRAWHRPPPPEPLASAAGAGSPLPFPLPWTRVVLFQLARSLAFLHGKRVVHRDVKPANVLVSPQTAQVKLCDFGSAKQILDPAAERNAAYVCSRHYRAPELLFGSLHYTAAVDLWSLGCVTAELLRRGAGPLFGGCSTVDQMAEIFKVRGTPSLAEMHAMSPRGAEAIFGVCGGRGPAAPPADGAEGGDAIVGMDLAFLFPPGTPREAVDLVDQLLQYCPAKRLTAAAVVQHPFFDCLLETGAQGVTELPPLSGTTPHAGQPQSQPSIPLPVDMFMPVEEELSLYSPDFLYRMSRKAVSLRGRL